jgi:predicted nucleic acid-binding protein
VIVIDSSGWIEFFLDGPKAATYARYLQHPEKVFTPAIVVYEVYKKIKRERDERVAKLCVAQIEKTQVVPVTQVIALLAGDLSLEFSLPMADSLVLATARMQQSELITSDSDFQNIPGTRVV